MNKNEKKSLSEKQSALLMAARTCAISYVQEVQPRFNKKEQRRYDFSCGYLKAMKDLGYDVTQESSLTFDVVNLNKDFGDA